MANPLLPAAVLGGLFLILSGKKTSRRARKKESWSYRDYQSLPPEAVPNYYSGPQGSESASSWIERQEALKTLSQIEFDSIPLCAKCDPGEIDGNPGQKTRAAIKAFQAIAGLDPDGNWSSKEDLAMFRIFSAVKEGRRIECDPLLGYPAPFACFATEDGFVLAPSQSEGKILPDFPKGNTPEYGPDDLLVTDPECNYVLYQDPRWFSEQQRRAIIYALDGMTDGAAAVEIHESMLADFAPLCLSLGRDGVGPGLKDFWTTNASWINTLLMKYEGIPQLLEEDAKRFGLL